MKSKYPNKKKRKGFWKRYERASIKDYRKVWTTAINLALEQGVPFEFSEKGRKPNLSKEECVAMAVLYAYFDDDFREVEQLVKLLTNKRLDHTNCTRWFGRLNKEYVNSLVFAVHKKTVGIDDAGDYIADSTKATCDRLKPAFYRGSKQFEHITWKLHILAQYIFTLGLVSIVSVFSSRGEVNDSPVLRNHLLEEGKVEKSKRLHADKGYFGKENIKLCKRLGLHPNIVPKEQEYSDSFLRKYVKKEYDNQSRKQNRGLVEGPFGGIETETGFRIRCRKPKHRNILLALIALKHNLRTYFRATALMIISYFAPTPWRTKDLYKATGIM